VRILRDIEYGSIRCNAIDTREPSPFSHEILNSNPYTFLDNAPLEERRARAVQVRRALPEEAEELGRLDPAAIEQVRQESWPQMRDIDETHDALLTMIALPESDASDTKRRSANSWRDLELFRWRPEIGARHQFPLIRVGSASRPSAPSSPLALFPAPDLFLRSAPTTGSARLGE